MALFDGINNFYCRNDENILFEKLKIPANTLDRYVPLRYYEYEKNIIKKHKYDPK